jgi:hypothetical protein
MKPLPDAAVLRENFVYDEATGVLRWRKTNLVATLSTSTAPHVGIGPGKRKVVATRVIWKLVTGEEASDAVKHRNGDRYDLRWSNLMVPERADSRRKS